MSCCDGCAQGMGCCGSSGLSGLYGLNGLMGALYPDSRVRTGFAFKWAPDLGYDPSDNEAQLVSVIKANLNNFLNDGVAFSDVNVFVDPLPGWFSDGYITVTATTKTELPDANVFGDMVQYAIDTYLLIINRTRHDETLIDYVAPAARNQPGVQQAGPPKVCDWNTMDFRDYIDCQLGIGKFSKQQTQQQQQQGQKPPAPPGECDWDTLSFGDWVACNLGIKGTVGGIAAGATGALVGVGVLTVIGIVLLKR